MSGTHIDRMQLEYNELYARLTALYKFIKENPIFQTLEKEEQDRMTHQSSVMRELEIVLGQRIEYAKNRVGIHSEPLIRN